MRIVCLSNSFRVGGRCLGGIEINQDGSPVIVGDRPKWVRPVCNTEHEEVPTDLVSHISLLDIIEFVPIQSTGHGHQSENVLFDEKSIKVVGRYPISSLHSLIDNEKYFLVFGNKGAAVKEHIVSELNHSLMLLELTDFATNERVFDNKPYPQIKLSFKHNGLPYNFPITDPNFLYKYQVSNDVLEGVEKIYVTLSLAAPHEEWASKLVAGIIYDSDEKSQPDDKNNYGDDDLPF